MRWGFISFFSLLITSTALADLKSTNKVIIAGQSFNSTVLMKQGKVRNEATVTPGLVMVTIQDCSSRRIIQLNERTHAYLTTDLGDTSNQAAPSSTQDAPAVVTLTVKRQDTGERKQMLGYTARHIKGTITSEGGNDSCQQDFRATTDGWYIDLPTAQGCAPPEGEMVRSRMQKDGCNDQMVLRTSGVEKLGYPVLLDVTMMEKQGSVTVHQETTELSDASLDPNLFEVPAGYSEVQSYEELAGFKADSMIGKLRYQQSTASSVSTNNGAASPSSTPVQNANPAAAKKTLRIGVVQIGSTVERSFSTDGLQQLLVNDLNFLGGQGVVISSDPEDREAALEQAKQQGCDYVVFTTINDFKTASVGEKLGSVFNRGSLGGVGGSGQGRVQLNAEVKVFLPDGATPMFDGDVNFRQNDPDGTARGLMQTEARNVMLQIRKLQTSK
jgi:hypothetical protein